MKNSKRGFTLIELLVVVLIIGILAAVALPQYQKAVRKARMVEMTTMFKNITKAMDLYFLANGYPTSRVEFLGTSAVETDIDLPCAATDSNYCYTKVGRWSAGCSATRCTITIESEYNADKTTGNTWLKSSEVSFTREGGPQNSWKLFEGEFDNTTQSEICRWVGDMGMETSMDFDNIVFLLICGED